MESELIETQNIEVYVNKQSKKCLNEFEFDSTISRGLTWKVKKAFRYFKDQKGDLLVSPYAIKKSHINTQKRTKYMYYNEKNELILNSYYDKILSEIEIMKILGFHENVIQAFEVIQNKEHPYIYIVTEYCDIGNMMEIERDTDRFYYVQNRNLLKKFGIDPDEYQLITKGERYKLKLNISKLIFKQIINGLRFIHSKNISHRDIKPENILYSTDSESFKIIDFSISTIVNTNDKKINEPGGSIFFQAPEVCMSERYDPFLGDIWALGVVFFIFLADDFPFFAMSELELQIKASENEIEFPDYFDVATKELINSMMNKNPHERPNLEKILDFDYFK